MTKVSDSRPPITRRQILRGTAGAAVGLPFLPSLVPRSARAATPGGPPRLVLIAQTQGAWYQYLHGTAGDNLPNKKTIFTGHDIAYGPIASKLDGGRRVVSHILSADGAAFSEHLLGKMNIVRGIDTVTKSGHHDGMFGNVWNQVTKGEVGIPSIDQLVAWSPSYYKDAGFKERSLTLGMAGPWSYFHSNPATRTGDIQKVVGISDPGVMWDRLFSQFTAPSSTPMPTPAAPTRKPLVDHLLGSYKSLREANTNLSMDDKRRLDGHIEMLAELERRVKAAPATTGAGCTKPTRSNRSWQVIDRRGRDAGVKPRAPAESIELHRLYNDLIVAAFKCGMSRVATLAISEYADTFSTYGGGWHGLAHDGGTVNGEPTFGDAYQKVFEHVVLDLARKLDEDEGGGKTYLDNTLIVWTNEHGARSHNPVDKMMITFGAAGGHYQTGLFVDYRNKTPQSLMGSREGFVYHTGLTTNQWWANVLHAMGIPDSEWSRYTLDKGTGKGYGPTVVLAQDGLGTLYDRMYRPQALSGSGDKLPVLTV